MVAVDQPDPSADPRADYTTRAGSHDAGNRHRRAGSSGAACAARRGDAGRVATAAEEDAPRKIVGLFPSDRGRVADLLERGFEEARRVVGRSEEAGQPDLQLVAARDAPFLEELFEVFHRLLQTAPGLSLGPVE